jgi:hypothetical protein
MLLQLNAERVCGYVYKPNVCRAERHARSLNTDTKTSCVLTGAYHLIWPVIQGIKLQPTFTVAKGVMGSV